MNDYVKKMVDDAIRHIDSLSIDELEKEFRSFGLDAIRKKNVPHFTNHFSSFSLSTAELDVVKNKNVVRSHPTGIEFKPVKFVLSLNEQADNDEFYYLRDYNYKIAA